ncbi:MAG: hypothetical protein Q3999_04600 [Buchananella hordeovulneris]|nr:hypothetical protein [Buchananella hordeovulneris]
MSKVRRDVAEGRKRLPVILRRGVRLLRLESALVAGWVADGCEPMDVPAAERRIRRAAVPGAAHSN